MPRFYVPFTRIVLLAGLLCSPAAAVEEIAAPRNAVADDPTSAAQVVSPEGQVVIEGEPVVVENAPAADPHHAASPAPALVQPGHAHAQPAPPHAAAAPLHFPGHAPAVCCEKPKIRYWNHPLLARDVCPCDCNQTYETHLEVPCRCCPVAVKVCVPVCCTGAPKLDISRDLLGRKVYDFCWACGYRVKVVDRHTGTLVVHTFDR